MSKLIFTLSLVVYFISVQFTFAQIRYVGQVDLTSKDVFFALKSDTDSLMVTINKKNIEFNKTEDYQLIKIKGKNYNLISNGDTISVSEVKKQIEFSTGLLCTISKKKAHQIVLNDKNGEIKLEARYTSKGNIANYTILIFDEKYEMELLTYATNYLFVQSLNEANYVPTYMYFIY